MKPPKEQHMTDHHCTHQTALIDSRPLDGKEAELVRKMLQFMPRPEAKIEQVVAGSKFIAVVAGGRMALSSLLGAQPTQHESGLTETLIGKTAAQAAGLLSANSPFSICLGMAALNAASTPDPASVVESGESAETLISQLGRDATVGLVGDFPFVGRLRQKVGSLHLFELRDTPGAVPADQWASVLPHLDVLAITATTLLTRNMAYFLTLARQAAIVVLGPTTPRSCALFEFGADYLCGSVIVDHHRVLEGIRAGWPFKAIKKKGGIKFTCWRLQDCPG
jgi:uncharacterized protein (DUF4213/DUF364 family)